MKNLFLIFILSFFVSNTFASNGIKEKSKINNEPYDHIIEYEYSTNKQGQTTCYARFCWNISEYIRDCSDWFEVPCDTTLTLETVSAD